MDHDPVSDVMNAATTSTLSSKKSTITTDEILQDGTKVRTLETAAATIRFCFIDDPCTDSDDEDVASQFDDNASAVTPTSTSALSEVHRVDFDDACIDSDKDLKFVPASDSNSADSMNSCDSNTMRSRVERPSCSVDEDQRNSAFTIATITNRLAVSPTSEYYSGSESNNDFKVSRLVKIDANSVDNAQVTSKHKESEPVSVTSEEIVKSVPAKNSSSSHTLLKDRFNPFDKAIAIEEDHFCVDNTPTIKKPNYRSKLTINRPHSTSSSNSDDLLISVDEDEFVFAHLGLDEDHFSQPEGHFGFSTTEELEMAIEHCKDLIVRATNEEKKIGLVKKLVQLRLKLQEAKEEPQEIAPDMKLVLGHHFQRQESHSAKHYCEKCVAVIWGMLQIWYRCTDCGYCCHSKCLGGLTRMCASTKVQESGQYIVTICPEKGLAVQQYRCFECRSIISFQPPTEEPRQCDYNGCYYCSLCHWNDTYIIPARVLHNWDFTPAKVCRANKQFLKLMLTKPAICIQKVNPMLFSFVEELNEIRRIRQQIMMMKTYFLSCQEALTSKLLLQLKDRQHFVDNSDMYCMKDLIDLENKLLLPYLCKIHTNFAQHIKTDCHLCQAKGHICELCREREPLFPFDNHVVQCDECKAVLHKHCFRKKDGVCPRCHRKKVLTDQFKTTRGSMQF